MLTKLKETFIKPVNDTPSIETLDALNSLIESRQDQINRSGDYLGHVRCFIDPATPNLIYVPKHEQPLLDSTFLHATSRKLCSVLSRTNQAGRCALEFKEFSSSVSFFSVATKYDYERAKHFSRLVASPWSDIPSILSTSELTLELPRAYKPDAGGVVYHNVSAKHYRILSVTQEETHTLCKIEIVEVA